MKLRGGNILWNKHILAFEYFLTMPLLSGCVYQGCRHMTAEATWKCHSLYQANNLQVLAKMKSCLKRSWCKLKYLPIWLFNMFVFVVNGTLFTCNKFMTLCRSSNICLLSSNQLGILRVYLLCVPCWVDGWHSDSNWGNRIMC